MFCFCEFSCLDWSCCVFFLFLSLMAVFCYYYYNKVAIYFRISPLSWSKTFWIFKMWEALFPGYATSWRHPASGTQVQEPAKNTCYIVMIIINSCKHTGDFIHFFFRRNPVNQSWNILSFDTLKKIVYKSITYKLNLNPCN